MVLRLQVLYAKGILAYFSWLFFLGMSAHVALPLYPVPITLQTFSFLLVGLLQKPFYTFSLGLCYILLGIVGLPMFYHIGAGFTVLVSPSFGYVIGLPVTAIIFSLLKSHIQNFFSFCAFTCLSIIPLYCLGLLYLSIYLHSFSLPIFIHGCLVFLPTETLKILYFYAVYKKICKSDGL